MGALALWRQWLRKHWPKAVVDVGPLKCSAFVGGGLLLSGLTHVTAYQAAGLQAGLPWTRQSASIQAMEAILAFVALSVAAALGYWRFLHRMATTSSTEFVAGSILLIGCTTAVSQAVAPSVTRGVFEFIYCTLALGSFGLARYVLPALPDEGPEKNWGLLVSIMKVMTVGALALLAEIAGVALVASGLLKMTPFDVAPLPVMAPRLLGLAAYFAMGVLLLPLPPLLNRAMGKLD